MADPMGDLDLASEVSKVLAMTPEVFAQALSNARRVAEKARMAADTYARTGTTSRRVAGAGFARRGGIDAYWLTELRCKADDAERAVRELEELTPILGPTA